MSELEDLLEKIIYVWKYDTDKEEAKTAIQSLIKAEVLKGQIAETYLYFGKPTWHWDDSKKRMQVSRAEIYERIKDLEQQLKQLEGQDE